MLKFTNDPIPAAMALESRADQRTLNAGRHPADTAEDFMAIMPQHAPGRSAPAADR